MPTPYPYTPVNVQQGNTANFVVEYFDGSGSYTKPLSGSVQISYTNTANVATTDIVSLTLTNRFFTGSWDTSVAKLGLATWTVIANSTTIAETGQIRVIQRQGG